MNLHNLLGGLGERGRVELGRVEEGIVCVKFSPASKYELRFYPPDPETAARIRARENDDHLVPVRLDLVNRGSGKSVRGFSSHINPWWLRKFVFAIAAAVAYTEREWQTLPQEFIDKMKAQD